jgi:hypothetical protein
MMNSSSSTEKRGRMPNFIEFEKNLLIDLVKEHEIVCSKQKDSATTHQKDKAWGVILETFNRNANVNQRDMDSLKGCLENLQTKAKKEDCGTRSSLRKTGGGPSSPIKVSATSATLIEIMPQVFGSLEVLDNDASGLEGK